MSECAARSWASIVSTRSLNSNSESLSSLLLLSMLELLAPRVTESLSSLKGKMIGVDPHVELMFLLNRLQSCLPVMLEILVEK